jgi:hypothetical protein
MSKRIALLVCVATCVCASAVAQDNTKPGSADSKQSGSPNDQGFSVLQGKSASAITPIFSEIVMSQQPVGFHEAYQNTNGGHYTLEMVLKGETVDQWSQMITVTGVQGHSDDPNVTAKTRIEFKASAFKKACPDTFAAKPLGPMNVSGHEAFVAWLSCGSSSFGGSFHSESDLVVSIKGTDDYYTIQWAERGPASTQPLAYDEAKWKDRFSRMNPMKVCPRTPGEGAPYPSCLNQK